MSSPAVTLAEAVKAHLLTVFPAPVDPAPAVHPTISRLWRVDLVREDVPENGMIYVTLGAATRERNARRGFSKGFAVNVVSIGRIITDSKNGPSNGDTFADLHDAIGTALEAMPEAAGRNLISIDEELPLVGQIFDGTDILLSTFTLTFK